MYNRFWILPRNPRGHLFYLIVSALLIALSIVFSRYLSIMLPGNFAKLTLSPLPLIVAGLLLGPVYGGLTGLLADLLGVLIRSFGAMHYGLTLTSILFGVLPGLVVWAWKRLDRKVIVTATLSCSILLSALLNTRWMMDFSHVSFTVQFLQRLPGIVFNALILLIASLLLLPALRTLSLVVARNNQTAPLTQSHEKL